MAGARRHCGGLLDPKPGAELLSLAVRWSRAGVVLERQ